MLVVEDDRQIVRTLRTSLQARGYDVLAANDGTTALGVLRSDGVDLVILDLGLPDLDGLEVLTRLRTFAAQPVIVLTVRDSHSDKVAARDRGAGDYVIKPFDMEELLARLRAALRRDDRSPRGARFTIGRCEIDLAAHTIVRAPPGADPEPLHLTPTEWRLLEILLNAPGQLVSSDRLLGEVWGPGFERSTHYLRFHMAGLRRKLEEDPHRPRHLLTEPGMGYRYQP